MMIKALIARIGQLLRREHWWAEFWSAVVAICWGAQNAFDASDLHAVPQYDIVVNLAGEAALEAGAVVVGLAQLCFLTAGTAWLRGASAFLACWFYSLFAVAFLASGSPVPGLVFVLGWVGVNVFAIVRLTQGLK